MQDPPPSYSPPSQSRPAPRLPAGDRVFVRNRPFPPPGALGGPAPFKDGNHLIFVASAITPNLGVIPCKASAGLEGCRYGYAGVEHAESMNYDILVITSEMEWVATRDGLIPAGKTAIGGGYELSGAPLYHALVSMKSASDVVQVPGKTGGHLRGALVPYGGAEVEAKRYQILCWRQ